MKGEAMRYLLGLPLIGLALGLGPGCSMFYRSPVQPFVVSLGPGESGLGSGIPPAVPAFIYGSYKAPLTTDFRDTPARPARVGRAHTTYIMLPLIIVFLDIAFDDASVRKAASNGGIKTIHYADYEMTTVLGLFGSYETIVHGE